MRSILPQAFKYREALNISHPKCPVFKNLFDIHWWIKQGTKGNVYLDQLFGAVCTHKQVEILCFAVFNLFCSFQTFFSDFLVWNQEKTFEKLGFKLLFNSIEINPHSTSLRALCGYLEVEFYRLIFFISDWKINEKRLKLTKKQKRLKIAKQGFWPASGCTQHQKAGWNTQQKGLWISKRANFSFFRREGKELFR